MSRTVDDDTRYNIHENECYATTMHASVVNREGKKEAFSKKKFFCILMISVAIILLIIAVFISIVFAFIEISNLKNISNQELAKLNNKCEANGRMLNVSMLKFNQLRQDYSMLENRTQELIDNLENLGLHPSYPAASCAVILQLAPSPLSGHYWIRSSNGSAVHIYCDMTRSCGNITGGWMRVAELDMRDNSSQCPSPLNLRTDSNIRTCGNGSQNATTCSSVIFPTNAIQYSKVCGMIKAYQYGNPDTFGNSSRHDYGIIRPRNIELDYVDGISLTHGNPRQHIWTFAAGLDEVGTFPILNCPCTNTRLANLASRPPAFVGNDYFCDTASKGRFQYNTFYPNNPLWDGAGCGPLNTCCSLNNPPWFYKQLPQHTSDDIEMRLCSDEGSNNEDTPIEIINLYIQ